LELIFLWLVFPILCVVEFPIPVIIYFVVEAGLLFLIYRRKKDLTEVSRPSPHFVALYVVRLIVVALLGWSLTGIMDLETRDRSDFAAKFVPVLLALSLAIIIIGYILSARGQRKKIWYTAAAISGLVFSLIGNIAFAVNWNNSWI
jgi:hypothetical protein